jgi:hypothetical protein
MQKRIRITCHYEELSTNRKIELIDNDVAEFEHATENKPASNESTPDFTASFDQITSKPTSKPTEAKEPTGDRRIVQLQDSVLKDEFKKQIAEAVARVLSQYATCPSQINKSAAQNSRSTGQQNTANRQNA